MTSIPPICNHITMTLIEQEIEASVRKVQAVTGYSLEEIRAKSRKQHLVFARMLLVHELRNKKFTLQAIGKTINRTHMAVMHLLSRYDDEYETNPLFREMADRIV